MSILSQDEFIDTIEELIWKATNRESTSREYWKILEHDEEVREHLPEGVMPVQSNKNRSIL